MRIEFSIRAVSAVARGLREPSQWQAWAASPELPAGELEVDVSYVPAMARRRLGRLAKMAVMVADDVLNQAQLADVPIVWASRHGDAQKSLELLRAQVRAEPLSPTSFGLSVHNGIGAQHSILRGMVSNAICVASSNAVPEAGVVEAFGMLHDGASDVVLVCYDEPLPGEYAQFTEEPVAEFAWAILVSSVSKDLPSFSLAVESGDADTHVGDTCTLPHGLQVFRFLLSPLPCAGRLAHGVGRGAHWIWERLDD